MIYPKFDLSCEKKGIYYWNWIRNAYFHEKFKQCYMMTTTGSARTLKILNCVCKSYLYNIKLDYLFTKTIIDINHIHRFTFVYIRMHI